MVEYYITDTYGDSISTKQNLKCANDPEALNYAIVLAQYMQSVVQIAWGQEGCVQEFKIVVGLIPRRIKLMRRTSRTEWERIEPQDVSRYFSK